MTKTEFFEMGRQDYALVRAGNSYARARLASFEGAASWQAKAYMQGMGEEDKETGIQSEIAAIQREQTAVSPAPTRAASPSLSSFTRESGYPRGTIGYRRHGVLQFVFIARFDPCAPSLESAYSYLVSKDGISHPYYPVGWTPSVSR